MYSPGQIFEFDGAKYLVLPNNKAAEIARFDKDGIPVLRTTVTQKEEGYDKYGIKKVSTSINVEPFDLTMKEQQ